MKILIYGTGPLGSLCAARLQRAGHAVSLLARGPRLAELLQHGVVLEDAITGERTVTPVQVVEKLGPEDAYDLVLVAMRKNQVPAVLPALAANGHTPNVVFIGNNAAGPYEYVQALGRERVLMGFVSAGGMRAGSAMRILAGQGDRKAKVILGELDGRMTPRLKEIASVFESAGFAAVPSPRIDAWLKTHAAVVSPIALALYLAGGDNYRLARTRDGIVLAIRGLREGLRVLRALDIPITPSAARIYEYLPEPILVPIAQRLFATEFASIGLAGHANAARDEMKQIADEFRALSRATAVPTPALDRLYAYLDPAVAPADIGRAEIPLDWRSIWVGLGVLGAATLLVAAVARKRGLARKRKGML